MHIFFSDGLFIVYFLKLDIFCSAFPFHEDVKGINNVDNLLLRVKTEGFLRKLI